MNIIYIFVMPAKCYLFCKNAIFRKVGKKVAKSTKDGVDVATRWTHIFFERDTVQVLTPMVPRIHFI